MSSSTANVVDFGKFPEIIRRHTGVDDDLRFVFHRLIEPFCRGGVIFKIGEDRLLIGKFKLRFQVSL